MSDTQSYKTVTISDAEEMQLVLALEKRKEELKIVMLDFEEIDWKKSAAKCRADLDIVNGLINRLCK